MFSLSLWALCFVLIVNFGFYFINVDIVVACLFVLIFFFERKEVEKS